MALANANQEKLICLHKQAMSERAMASRLLEVKSTIHDIISQFKMTGNVEDKPCKRQPTPPTRLNKVQSQFYGFLGQDTWPPSSPDLNPMDFSI
jgi:hypothetical protein